MFFKNTIFLFLKIKEKIVIKHVFLFFFFSKNHKTAVKKVAKQAHILLPPPESSYAFQQGEE